ncbi:hypothetical protein LX36DRAFT_459131 [Colletotrichum falcatum]|nr:hypothetical protein LX36DRAFT_459131 [Colletotrichum falcatum]
MLELGLMWEDEGEGVKREGLSWDIQAGYIFLNIKSRELRRGYCVAGSFMPLMASLSLPASGTEFRGVIREAVRTRPGTLSRISSHSRTSGPKRRHGCSVMQTGQWDDAKGGRRGRMAPCGGIRGLVLGARVAGSEIGSWLRMWLVRRRDARGGRFARATWQCNKAIRGLRFCEAPGKLAKIGDSWSVA